MMRKHPLNLPIWMVPFPDPTYLGPPILILCVDLHPKANLVPLFSHWRYKLNDIKAYIYSVNRQVDNVIQSNYISYIEIWQGDLLILWTWWNYTSLYNIRIDTQIIKILIQNNTSIMKHFKHNTLTLLLVHSVNHPQLSNTCLKSDGNYPFSVKYLCAYLQWDC